ncbi:restriction endonuclease subunit S [Serratia fonticola]|uniref:restriction endonuclease subunit S n=1 Tax=Serratia fonticola TaxID=47917 RepID=UPI00301D0F80
MTEQQIPEGWQMVKFGDIAKHISKRIEPSETDLEIYVGLEHLDPDNLKIKRHGVPSDVEGQKLLVKKGQIIFGKRRAYQRKVAVADWDCICSAHAMVLEANSAKVIPDFLPFFMQSDAFMSRAVAISEGSLSPTIKWKVLAEQKFKIPPKNEQEIILRLLFKSQKVVNKAVLAFEASLKAEKMMAASWFSPTSEKIRHEKLSSLADENGLQTGPFGSQLHAKEYSNEGIPVFMPKELGFGEIDVNASSKIPEKVADRLTRHRLIEGDFIFGRRGDIGRFGYITKSLEGAVCGTGCLRFRPKNKNLAGFYNAFFRSESASRWLNQNAVGMTMLNLNTEILGELPVPLMNEADYEKTALIFQCFEIQRYSLNRCLAANKKLMSSLINR